ncbi:GH92 family glycosyl hydrolase [Mucilaginibacter sp. CSA2-8R]|uniref:GH92 family glycosyl hydrolase n=1 Tax=Mucilaginibacter sp. CSA2-8R TaxID=3141542 RepID=UPI00315CEFA7
MKSLSIVTGVLLCMVTACFAQGKAKRNYAGLVNTLIGTKGKGAGINERYLESGYTFPGAMYPFGMVQFTPTFFDEGKGFVVNQLSGAGCDHMGNFPTLPLEGKLNTSPDAMAQLGVKYQTLNACAGYYSVKLNNGIKAELTVTPRTGLAKYTAPDQSKNITVIIGSGINATQLQESHAQIIGNRVEGYADGGSFCSPKIKTNYRVYFVAEFNVTPEITGNWKNKKIEAGAQAVDGSNSGLYFTFNTSKQKVIQYKFAISYVSVANAKENLQTENKGWNFNQIIEQTQQAWNNYLGKIEVTGASSDRIIQFYTHFYHALAHPSLFSDVNGQYVGADEQKHQVNIPTYTAYSNWDTYRTQIQLLSLLAPKESGDMVTSLINFAKQSGGGWPRWVMANKETGIMQGDPTSILVANAYAFGARNFDKNAALDIMRKGAEMPGTRSQQELTRPQLEQYINKGYADASMSLEYNSADFAIAQFARQALKDNTLYGKYLKRAQYWKNLYNPLTGWLQSRNTDGSWKKYDEDWREASFKNYFWMVPFNLKKLIDTIGGKGKAEARLDSFFKRLNATYNQQWFAAGNEPDFQVPWVYNWTNAPYKTQVLVKRIIREQYTNRANGLPGNDDLGAMGAWYVFANIGLYPMMPGVGGFSINSPSFSLIKIHLPGNKKLIISGGNEQKAYIKQLLVNGKPAKSTWISLNEIMNGGELHYVLTDKAPQSNTFTVAPPFYD